MLFAAALRIVIECVTLLALPLPDMRAMALRNAMMWLGRAAFFVGVPAWLGLRLVSG
jgi:apolipoprotein N-acyltransferase